MHQEACNLVQSRELQREELPPPELSPTTPPLTQKAVRTASRRNSRSTTPAATPRSSHQAVDGTPRNSLSSRPPTELPDAMAEEVMARLARRLPDVNLNVRTANNRQAHDSDCALSWRILSLEILYVI